MRLCFYREIILLRRGLRDTSNPFSLTEHLFRQYFRLSRASVQTLIADLEEELGEFGTARRIPNHLKILTALQFYGHGSYQKIVGQDFFFPMSQATVSNCLNEVTDAIIKCLSQNIHFPATNEEIKKKKQEFMLKTGFPGTVGCVDGTHIGIISPPIKDARAPALLFYNRKRFFSLNVQIICDAGFKILNINTKYPGSVHDSAIWLTSRARQIMKNRFDEGDKTSWLIGDLGYPLEPWLLVPVAETIRDTPEARYNIAFRKTRILVEQCIGHLKSVFRCLHKHRTLHYSPKTAGNIVAACAILHNIRIMRNEHRNDVIDEDSDEDDDDEENVEHTNVLRQGQHTRQRLIRARYM